MAGAASCDPADIAKVAAEQARNTNNVGVGVIDLQTNKVRVFPYDETDRFAKGHPHLQVIAGHEAAAIMAGFTPVVTRGFILALDLATSRWHVVNRSHLNLPDGQGHRMTQNAVGDVVAALLVAGVTNPVVIG